MPSSLIAKIRYDFQTVYINKLKENLEESLKLKGIKIMISIFSFIYAIKAFVAASIFFVWVVRYREIIEEFKFYELPSWLRDLVGILKLSFAFMLFSDDIYVTILGASGIIFLMAAAIYTHVRVKNPFHKMIPAFSLSILNLMIILYS